MPIFDYQCDDCQKTSEVFMVGMNDVPKCGHCGSENMKKLLSAHSSLSGPVKFSMPGPGDTACCGSSPEAASNCAGPGTCCGKNV